MAVPSSKFSARAPPFIPGALVHPPTPADDDLFQDAMGLNVQAQSFMTSQGHQGASFLPPPFVPRGQTPPIRDTYKPDVNDPWFGQLDEVAQHEQRQNTPRELNAFQQYSPSSAATPHVSSVNKASDYPPPPSFSNPAASTGFMGGVGNGGYPYTPHPGFGGPSGEPVYATAPAQAGQMFEGRGNGHGKKKGKKGGNGGNGRVQGQYGDQGYQGHRNGGYGQGPQGGYGGHGGQW
ncbi:hypothetical protein CC80DRAFT_80012 [Byssothecium circinans]|uniref:Uncharacterized protein n=1 Tax=Byssothecium circinans TaxID=147558 RepID=A0A6A5TYR0_9PLEO|nr:hypothetical protein CC80DRAFT_80012 [Byssothecium circinans]